MLIRAWSLVVAGALWALPVVAVAEPAHEHAAAGEEGEDLQSFVPGASRLEGRLLAPCCWNQTIDIHGSEPAYQLRREIRRRLSAGETPDAVEASIVQRFGTKILAVPTSSPLGGLATGLAVVFGGAGVAAFFMLRRWSRAGAATKKKNAERPADSAAKSDALDARLDRELAEISD